LLQSPNDSGVRLRERCEIIATIEDDLDASKNLAPSGDF
jgi:hypothetical protein